MRVVGKGWGIFELYRWRPKLRAERKARGEGDMIEERNGNPAADTHDLAGRFRGGRAPTA